MFTKKVQREAFVDLESFELKLKLKLKLNPLSSSVIRLSLREEFEETNFFDD